MPGVLSIAHGARVPARRPGRRAGQRHHQLPPAGVENAPEAVAAAAGRVGRLRDIKRDHAPPVRPKSNRRPGLSPRRPRLYCARATRGGMAEWLKALAWKACIRETVSWVRIPLPPPPTPETLILHRVAPAHSGQSWQCFG
jgi:hypothetical protein